MNKEKELDINYAEIIDIDINSLDEYEKTEQFDYDRALDLSKFYLEKALNQIENLKQEEILEKMNNIEDEE